MPASYIQVPPDGSGKKLRTRQRVIGADTVEEQFIAVGAEPTYYVKTGPLQCAGNRIFLAFINDAGSGQDLKLRRLFIQNSQMAPIVSGTAPATVGMLVFDVKEISAVVGGATITPAPCDTADGALTGVTARLQPTSATEGDLLYSWYTNNDEIGLTGAFPQHMFQAAISSAIEGWEVREITLNPGQGFCVKCITNYTIGTFDVLAVISKEL